MKTDTTSFRMSLTTIDGIRAVVISDDAIGTAATIALRGATLLSWRVDLGDGPREFVDGYRNLQELDDQAGVRSGIMAPFTNRLRGGRYAFGGTEYDLGDAAIGSPRALLHGLLRDRPYALVESIATDDSFMLRLRNHDLADGDTPGYPFPVGVDVVYVIRRHSLDIDIVPTNFGEVPVPITTGWHPYFTLGAPVDDLVLTVPAAVRVVTSDDLIPLDSDDAFHEIRVGEPLDFRDGKPVGNLEIDAFYTDLDADAEGLHRTTLANRTDGVTLEVWQERGSVHVYTADHLERGARQSLAIEPVEAMTNAFNRPDQAHLVTLGPRQVRPFRFGASVRR